MWRWKFQSTPPCGGDKSGKNPVKIWADFNPRPLAGATRGRVWLVLSEPISIHAPLRGRRRPSGWIAALEKFQSTPPCGGDLCRRGKNTTRPNFNPRPLAGATHATELKGGDCMISIHAPLRGRRLTFAARGWIRDFNPRPLAGATQSSTILHPSRVISIHAPLRGRRPGVHDVCFRFDFNPRPLAGATPGDPVPFPERLYFNPRPLAGATSFLLKLAVLVVISIHAPLRGRPADDKQAFEEMFISIHAPLRGRLLPLPVRAVSGVFQSTPPCGGDYF